MQPAGLDAAAAFSELAGMPETVIRAASVALLKGEFFLLVERGREPSRGLFAFPGGKIEPGETPEACARRELFEETRLAAPELTLFQAIDLQAGPTTFRLHVFSGAWESGEPLAGDDAASVGWYSLAVMKGLPMTASTLAAAEAIVVARDAAAKGRL